MPYNYNEEQPLDNSRTLYGAAGPGLDSFDTVAPTTDTTTNKINRLQDKKQQKLDMLTGYKEDVLIGMQDADTLITLGTPNGSGREVLAPNAFAYDAVETAHYINGGLSKTDPYDYVKKRDTKQDQIQYVADVLGKPVDQLTNQDFIDVGNQQQIQKLAALSGEKDWKAPLIRGVEPTNLTGKYKDENGDIVDIPLNVPITSKDWGQTDTYGRELMSYGSTRGAPVTVQAALDLTQNVQASKAAQKVKELMSGKPTNSGTGSYHNMSDESFRALTQPVKEDSSFLDDVVNVGRAFGGGVLSLAELGSKAPKKLYNALGGDYLESNSTYDTSVKAIIDAMYEGGEYIKKFNNTYIDNDKSKREALYEAWGEEWDKTDESVVGKLIGGVAIAAQNPFGALEMAGEYFIPSKALASGTLRGLGTAAKAVMKGKGASAYKALASNVKSNTGFLVTYNAMTADTANQMVDEYKKTFGHKPNESELRDIMLAAPAITAMDAIADKFVLGAKGSKVGTAVKSINTKLAGIALSKISNPTIKKLMAGTVALGLRGGEDVLVEGSTEGLQAYGQHAVSQQTTDISDAAKKDTFLNTMGGAASGPGMHAINYVEGVAASKGKGLGAFIKAGIGAKKSKEETIDSDSATDASTLPEEDLDSHLNNAYQTMSTLNSDPEASSLDKLDNASQLLKAIKEKRKRIGKKDKEAAKELDDMDIEAYTAKQNAIGEAADKIVTAMEEEFSHADLEASSKKDISKMLKEDLGIKNKQHRKEIRNEVIAEIANRVSKQAEEASRFLKAGTEVEKVGESAYLLEYPQQYQAQEDGGDEFEIPITTKVIVHPPKEQVEETANGTYLITNLKGVTIDTSLIDGVEVGDEFESPADSSAEVEDKPAESIKAEIESPTANTETHTEGLSVRLIKKLAKEYNVPANELQKTLNSALGTFVLRKMKSVSKTADKVQYNKYFGKDGIIPTYTAYRSALESGDDNKAVEMLHKLRTIGVQQEQKLNRYATKYNELEGKLQSLMDKAVQMHDKDTASIVEATKKAITVLGKKEVRDTYTPQYATSFKLHASDVIKDVSMPAEVRAALGIEEGSKSNAYLTMEAIYGSIAHTDDLLSIESITRPEDKGYEVFNEDDLVVYQKALENVKKELAKLEKKKKLDEWEEVDKGELETREKDLEAGINRVEKELSNPLNSKKRWVSFNRNEVKAKEARLKELNSKKTKTKKEAKEIKTLTEELKNSRSIEPVISHVETLLGKKFGTTVKGIQSSRATTRDVGVLKHIKENVKRYVPSIAVNDTKVEEEIDAKDFKPKASSAKLASDVTELKEKTTELNKTRTRTKRIVDKINNLISKKVDDLTVTRDKFGNHEIGKDLLAYDKAIATGETELDQVRNQISELKAKKAKIAKGIEKSINNYAEKLKAENGKMDGVKEEIENTLNAMTEKVSGEITTDTSRKELDALRNKLNVGLQDKVKNGLSRLKNFFINLRGILKRNALARENGILDKEIANLESRLGEKEKELSKTREEKASLLKTLESPEKRAEVERKLAQISKLYKLKSQVKEGQSEKVSKLVERINELVSNLRGTNVVNMAADNGLKANEDIASNKDKQYEQPLKVNDLVEFKDSVLGAISIDSLITLIDDESIRNKLKARLDNAPQVFKSAIQLKSKKEFQLLDSPMSGLLFTNNGSVNSDIAKIIATNALSWVGINGTGLLFNDDTAIMGILGYTTEGQVKYADRKVLQRAGKLRKNVAYSLGSDIYNSLGMKAKDGIPEAIENKIKSDLGLMGIAYLSEAGLIENMTTTSISSEDWNSINEYKQVGDKEKVNTVKGKKTIKGKDSKQEYDAIREEVKALNVAIDVLPDRSDYYHHPIKATDAQLNKIKGSMWDVPNKAKKVLKKLMLKEHKVLDLRHQFNRVYGEGEAGRLAFLKANGWKDLEEMRTGEVNYSADSVDVQEGVNRGLEAEYDQLFELYNDIDNGIVPNSIYFKYVFTIGGRFNLDSGTINPQGKNLLHRWLVTPTKAQNTEWDMNSDDFKYFKEAVLQGFGAGTDKLGDESIDSKFETLKEVDLDDIVNGIKENGEYVNGNLKIEAEAPGHFLMALEAMEKYHEAVSSKKAKFVATAIAEYDSVTSGFANRLMQVPIVNNLFEWLQKVGVFKKSEFTEGTMGGMIENAGLVDSYKTLVMKVAESDDELKVPKKVKIVNGETTTEEYGEEAMTSLKDDWGVEGSTALPSLTDVAGKVTSAARNMFKYPFMIFNYGASIATIRKNLSRDIAAPILQGIMNGAYNTDTELMKYLGLTTEAKLNKFIEDMKNSPADLVSVVDDGSEKYPVTLLEGLINGTYGALVESTMNSLFGDIVKYNEMLINSTKLMFGIFEQTFRDKVAKQEEALSRPLTKEEVDEIIYSLQDQFPIFKGPLSEGTTDGIAIFSSTLAAGDSKYVSKGGIKVHAGNNKYVESTVQALKRQLSEAHAAGAVLPLHWIDGSIIHDVMANDDVQGIHDAITIGKNHAEYINQLNGNMLKVGKDYNLTLAMVDSLLKSMSTVKDKAALDDLFKKATNDEEASVDEFLDDVKDMVSKVEENRKKLYNEELVIANFAGPKGTAYEYTPTGNMGAADLIKEGKLTDVSKRFSDKMVKVIESAIKEGC